MGILIRDNPEAGAKVGANVVRKIIQDKDKPVLALAPGRIPLRMYKELIRMNQSGELSFRNCTTFNLDEYGGFSPENKHSYHDYMMSNFFKHTDIDKMNVHLPDSCKEDLRESCRKYENLINDAGGVDLQVLGIGANRHIEFNEPSGSFASRTLVKILSKQTILDNLIYFDELEEVPRYVVTIGLETIMESKHCLLTTNGVKKS